MQPASGGTARYQWKDAQPQRFDIRVSEGRSLVASGGFTRRGAALGVTVSAESIAATGFYGQFWAPPAGTPRHPAMLEFGGSEGGLSGQRIGAALASAGHPTLDIAYFGEPGLPATLTDVPLEYFARALRWLARQPQVLKGQTYVLGGSRGSEAALLLGAHYPTLVHGVIASSPSDVSFGSYPAPDQLPGHCTAGPCPTPARSSARTCPPTTPRRPSPFRTYAVRCSWTAAPTTRSGPPAPTRCGSSATSPVRGLPILTCCTATKGRGTLAQTTSPGECWRHTRTSTHASASAFTKSSTLARRPAPVMTAARPRSARCEYVGKRATRKAALSARRGCLPHRARSGSFGSTDPPVKDPGRPRQRPHPNSVAHSKLPIQTTCLIRN